MGLFAELTFNLFLLLLQLIRQLIKYPYFEVLNLAQNFSRSLRKAIVGMVKRK